MTRWIAILSSIWLSTHTCAQTLPGWKLIWSDEFTQAENSSPDPAKWGFDIGGSGWGNNELQYYTSRTQNARIQNGQLVIEARAESFSGRNYTSARLLTKNKASWTFGRIEARIKLPRGQGIWPAFWMLGANIDSVNWPNCGEIDILENIGSLPSHLYGTVHGPGYSGGGGISGNYVLPGGAALADDFRVYAIEWQENRIRWFIDGQQFFTLTPANLPAGRSWVFNAPQFLILNVAVGGNWPGSPNGSTVFPQRMSVDYVRVYQPTGSSVTVDPQAKWLGYLNVSDLPQNGGAFRYGSPHPTSELRSVFNGPVLELFPNSTTDPSTFWYAGGGAPGRPGNKIVEANLYVEKTGEFSGKTVTFRGTVLSNTLTAAHSAVAYIRDFAPDFTSSTTITAPLTAGSFSISLNTAADANRHLQYGFRVTGPNVWLTDAGPFGSVRVTTAGSQPFFTWIDAFDFSRTAHPDLSPTGDSDGDQRINLLEFALDGNPASATATGKERTRIEQIAGSPALVFTLPVRNGAVFSGAPAKHSAIDGLNYTIEGSNQLSVFDREVAETPAQTGGMPSLNVGWTYRSFRLLGSPTTEPQGYLRAKISP